MSENVYVGPYLTCTQRKQTEDVKVNRCSNAKCKKHRKPIDDTTIKFCATCGSKIKPFAEKQPACINYHEVLTDDELSPVTNSPNDTFFLIPNEQGPREFGVDLDEPQDLTGVNIAEEMGWFARRYQTEIIKLAKVYDNVDVKWGVHYYYL
jgi:hypothetical protein